MKDIVIRKSSPYYKEFFYNKNNSFIATLYYSGHLFLLNGSGSPLIYFKFKHKKVIQNALYDILLKKGKIILKFVKITGVTA